MARKNRLSVPNGTYHVTSRIVNAANLLKDDALKEQIVDLIYETAEFSGVRVLAWCIMDNHFHLFVNVPQVPKKYWTDKTKEPETYAFGMRPVECEDPIWTPEGINKDNLPVPPRPEIAFTMPDEELLMRIQFLDGQSPDGQPSKRVMKLRNRWERLRKKGKQDVVEEEKWRFCHRMYNLSQFMKTVKERIVYALRNTVDHVGHVFEGRFFSGIIENNAIVRKMTALYIDYNPYKNGKIPLEASYRWSSFGQAEGGGPHSFECRSGIEEIWETSWEEARVQIRKAFDDGDDDSANEETHTSRHNQKVSDDAKLWRLCVQLIKTRVDEISRGAYIGSSEDFVCRISKLLPENFPKPAISGFLRLLRMLKPHSGKRYSA